MDPGLKIQVELGLKKFESMDQFKKQKVLWKINEVAKEKGYKNERELREQKPYIWDQVCSQVVQEM
jgi:hypothetical protein